MNFRSGNQRLIPRGLYDQIVKDDFFEGMDRSIRHGNVRIERFADAGKNDAFQECGACPNKIDGDEQDDENSKYPEERFQYTPALFW
jgi:hypothetical protein